MTTPRLAAVAGLLGLAVQGCAAGSIQLPRSWDDHYFDLVVDESTTRPTLAVLPFTAGKEIRQAGDFSASDVLSTELFKSGRFVLVERERLNAILDEQRLGRSGLVDENTAAEIGRLSGAAAVVFGGLSSASQQKIDKFSYDLIRTEVRIDARAADTSTGRLIFVQSATGTSETKVVTDAQGQVISGAIDPKAEFLNAAQAAVIELSQKLARQFPVVGFVVSCDSNEFVTDVGADKDASVGDRLVVLRPLERLTHPVTKKRVGWKKEVLALGQVQAVDASTSTAKILRRESGTEAIKAGDIVIVQKD